MERRKCQNGCVCINGFCRRESRCIPGATNTFAGCRVTDFTGYLGRNIVNLCPLSLGFCRGSRRKGRASQKRCTPAWGPGSQAGHMPAPSKSCLFAALPSSLELPRPAVSEVVQKHLPDFPAWMCLFTWPLLCLLPLSERGRNTKKTTQNANHSTTEWAGCGKQCL